MYLASKFKMNGMLKEYKLLIDKDCPLCQIYGNHFVRKGCLDSSAMEYYQTIEPKFCRDVDMERAKSEIAFHHIPSNKTIYGLDALLYINFHDKPKILKLFHLFPIHNFLQFLYFLISYNRKIFYPVKGCSKERTCTPKFHQNYRWAFILFVAIFTGFILNVSLMPIYATFNFEHVWHREFLICFGQIAWQGAVIYFLHSEKKLDYLGNMSTVSFLGGILLFPIITIQTLISIPIFFLIFYFGCVVSFMLWEHIRRCKLLDISLYMTFSWITFRIFILFIILIPIFI